MIKLISLVAALAVAPVALAAPTPGTSPGADCRAQLAAVGAVNFKSMYAPQGNNAAAMANCVRTKNAQASQQQANAAKQCTAERNDAGFAAAHEGKSFNAFYGASDNDRNAYGKCVSAKAKAKHDAQQAAELKAGKACKAQKASMGAVAFKAAHGGKANAFGKCVSKAVRAQQ